jgi:lysophospholipase L1-like esterase
MMRPVYVALGDSMSIDRYPDLDHADRQNMELPAAGLGAASLFARNDDAVWPEFAGQDLATRFPGIDCRFLAMDGATTGDVLATQIRALETIEGGADGIVTLTAGGNDLLSLVGAADDKGAAGVERILRDLHGILDAVGDRLPKAVVLVANVYDPTDGTGDLEGQRLRPQEMRWLRDYNAGVAGVCAARRARFVDVHAHFAGHGQSAPVAERWYWTGSLIEPGVVGASEIRRLWLAALDAGAAGARTRG